MPHNILIFAVALQKAERSTLLTTKQQASDTPGVTRQREGFVFLDEALEKARGVPPVCFHVVKMMMDMICHYVDTSHYTESQPDSTCKKYLDPLQTSRLAGPWG